MDAVGAVLLVLVLLAVVAGIPALCRVALRKMSASEGLREFLNAYGPPRLPIPGRDEREPASRVGQEQRDQASAPGAE